MNAFTPDGRKGDAATVFNWTRALLHFRAEHRALRRGRLTQLLVNKDQYAYLRDSPDEYVLVVLNRAGAAKPVEIDTADLPVAEGLRLASFSGSPEISVSQSKIVIAGPREVEIYWAAKKGSR